MTMALSRKSGAVAWALLLCCAQCFCVSGAIAQKSGIVRKDQILSAINPGPGTRGPVVRPKPKVTEEGYAVPEASYHISLPQVTFEKSKALLRADGKRQIQEMLKAMNASEDLRGVRFLIEGHTCSLGESSYNVDLSLKRARAVRDFLVNEMKVSPTRLDITGWGEERPWKSNTTEEGQQVNRRVDFVKLESASMPPVSRGMRSAVVPQDEDRFFESQVWGIPNGSIEPVKLSPANNVLYSDDTFQLRLTVREGSHIYILYVGASGKIQWLYPTEDIQYGRWHYFGDELMLPSDDEWYYLDNKTGKETFIVIASHEPLPDPKGLPQLIRQNGGKADVLKTTLGTDKVQTDTLVIEHR